jgi:hypothetical protein
VSRGFVLQIQHTKTSVIWLHVSLFKYILFLSVTIYTYIRGPTKFLIVHVSKVIELRNVRILAYKIKFNGETSWHKTEVRREIRSSFFYVGLIRYREKKWTREASGAHNCTNSFRHCQTTLLLAATVDEMAVCRASLEIHTL